MHIEVFPVVFEAYLEQEVPINVAVWDAIAPKIRDCLVAMNLGDLTKDESA